jgi:hypothetical protein
MFEFARIAHTLQARVFHGQVGRETLMQGDVNIPVNRRGDEESAELFVIRRQIRAAAAQSDAQG